MPVLKMYVSDEQAESIKAYAVESCRPVSNLLLDAVSEKAVRTKKHYPDGKVIVIPKKTLQWQSSAHRKESKRAAVIS